MKCKDCGGDIPPNEINSTGRHLVWLPCFDVVQERERAALSRAEAAKAERDDLRDAQNVLSEALEAARKTLVELSARVAELEATLASDAADENQYLDAYIDAAARDGETIKKLIARVAEMEAQLAAHGWRGVNTPPEASGEYEIGADYIPDVRRAEYHADTNMWYQQMSDGEWQLADWATRWRPIPPLPPASDTEEATTP